MRTASALLLILATPSLALGGEIYGTITPRAPGQEVKIVCEGRSQNAFTDQRGSYRLYVPQQGDCKISVFIGQRWTDQFTIYSSQKPVRYDLVISGNRLERQ